MTEPSAIEWQQGQPISQRFDDIYFSKENGLEETRYVFLKPNQLLERFKALQPQEKLIIGETGFGTGLNFLACCQLFKESNSQGQLLFISTEKYPLTLQELKQALQLWPELEPWSYQLIQQYPQTALPTQYHFLLDEKIELRLMIGDASESFKGLLASDHPNYRKPQWQGVNAWFLDGFSPAKNPELWSEALFKCINQLSAQGASYSTFTAAGPVRRGLKAAGFTVNKMPGFGSKRDMIFGKKEQEITTETVRTLGHKSPYPTPWLVVENYQPLTPGSTIAIIGGGLAGCHSARALAEKGYQVQLFEKQGKICTQGSSNQQAMLYAKLSADGQALGQFNLEALVYAQRFYQPYWQQHGQQCGVLQLAFNESTHQLYQQLSSQLPIDFSRWVTPTEASELAGIPIHNEGLFFPDSGWLYPYSLCQTLLNHELIQTHFNTDVKNIQFDGRWQLSTNNSHYSADAVVIANAYHANQFEQTRWLPIKPLRGQVSHSFESDVQINTVICGQGYCAPAQNNQLHFGASYTPKIEVLDILETDHIDNWNRLQELSNVFQKTPKPHSGNVGFRCSTKDYLPIVGPAPVFETTCERYQKLSHNANAIIHEANSYHPHLYLNVGHGSRGLCYTPLSAKVLASFLSGDTPAINNELVAALNPTRFLIRALIKRQVESLL